MVTTLEETRGSRTLAVGETIRAFLDEHPDLAHRPKAIADALGVKIGSAKSFSKAWRDDRKLSLLGPVYLQNVHLVTRTTPETVYPGSPPPGWSDPGVAGPANKIVRRFDLPPDGHLEIRWSPNGTAEVVVASTPGSTASEVLQAWAFAKAILPLDEDAPGTLSFEALRDGSSLRLDGLEAVSLRTAESLLLKAYRHSDRRGEAFRIEVRTPPMKYTLREAEAMLTDPRPLGRDEKLESLALQTEENTKATLWARREILHLRKAIDGLRGSNAVR